MVDLADLASSSPINDLTRLISSLSPIFLGSGKQVGTTDQNVSGQQAGTSTGATTGTATTGQTGTSTSTTGGTNVGTSSQLVTSGADPGIIANLIAQMNRATGLASDPNATNAIINNIIHTNLEAFAPTIGEANSAGIYNSSTLGLLSGEAAARSSAQAASAALNFQTSEQQIAGNIGAQLLGATKTQQTTGGTSQTVGQTTAGTTSQSTSGVTTQNTTGTTGQTTQQQQTGGTTQQTSPIIGSSGGSNLLLGAAGLAAPFLLNKLGVTGKDGVLSGLIDKIFGGNDGSAPISDTTTADLFGGSQPIDSGAFDIAGGAATGSVPLS